MLSTNQGVPVGQVSHHYWLPCNLPDILVMDYVEHKAYTADLCA